MPAAADTPFHLAIAQGIQRLERMLDEESACLADLEDFTGKTVQFRLEPVSVVIPLEPTPPLRSGRCLDRLGMT